LVIFIIKYDRFAQFTTENIVTHSHDKFLEIGRLSIEVRIHKEIHQFITVITEDDSSYAYAMKVTLRLLMSYIYDISSLKVNDLTLMLLTWRNRELIMPAKSRWDLI
jgi:hypothetical protein